MTALLTRTAIDRAGLTRPELEAVLRCCMTRIRRGVYVIRGECPSEEHKRLRTIAEPPTNGAGSDIDRPGLRGHTAKLRVVVQSYSRSLPEGSAFSHLSAALLWGLPVTRPIQHRAEAIHPSRSREYRQLRLRKRTLPDDDVNTLDGARVTTVRRTLIDVAHDYPLDISVPMIDHALRAGLVSSPEVAEISDAFSSRKGAPRARTAFALSHAVRESPAESICAVRFHELGLEGFIAQVEFRDETGVFIARVDFAHREARVIVEVNGEIKYVDGDAGAQRARRERRRDYRLRNLDYRVFQLGWPDLFKTEAFTEIRRAVSARHRDW